MRLALHLVLAVALGGPAALATADDAVLQPMERDFLRLESHAGFRAYHVAVRAALLGPEAHRSCEALVIPSFEREWAVYLEQMPTTAWQVVCSVMQQQLHGRAMELAERRARDGGPYDEAAAVASVGKPTWRFAAPLTNATAQLLARLWAMLLRSAADPDEPDRCIDGTGYYLFQWRPERGSMGGMARCPRHGSIGAAVLDVLLDLRSAAGSEGSHLASLDTALGRKAAGLVAALESTHAATAWPLPLARSGATQGLSNNRMHLTSAAQATDARR